MKMYFTLYMNGAATYAYITKLMFQGLVPHTTVTLVTFDSNHKEKFSGRPKGHSTWML